MRSEGLLEVAKSLDDDLIKARQCGGGCDSDAYAVELKRRGWIFLKINREEGALAKFKAEKMGLDALHATHTIPVPAVIGVGEVKAVRGGYIAMERLKWGGGEGDYAQFGHDLAALHMCATPQQYGFDVDNSCGASVQKNKWEDDWADFFCQHRIGFQLSLPACAHDEEIREMWERCEPVVRRSVLPPATSSTPVFPSLLHGDLWSGNWEALEGSGRIAIFDPASYYGHWEAEMSIMTMFGSPPRAFFDAYHTHLQRTEGYETRQELYQLYHYLNHFNLFGGGYRSACTKIMSSLLDLTEA